MTAFDEAYLAFSASIAPSQSKDLEFVQYLDEGEEVAQGLALPYSATITSDGLFIYVASTLDNYVSAYSRNPTDGTVAQIQAIQANDDPPTVNDFNAPVSGLLSPDENYLYVPAWTGDLLFAYSRNPTTGMLTEIQQINGPNTRGVAYIDISDDGENLYGAGYGGGAITMYTRDTGTGLLTVAQSITKEALGVPGLDQALYPKISPDGKFLYVASFADDSISKFSLDETTGEMTFVSSTTNGVEGVTSLDGPRWIEISSDGNFLYITALDAASILTFSRDLTTGDLTQLDAYTDAVGLQSARVVSLSPDEEYLFTNGYDGATVFLFKRDSLSGLLSLVDTYQDGFETDARGFTNTRDIEFSPDGEFVYIVSWGDPGMGVYRFEDILSATNVWGIY